MELIQQYLDSIQNLGGVYICKVKDGITHELVKEIGEAWRQRYGPGKPIVFVPEQMNFELMDRFDTSVAIMMLKSGFHLRRWGTGGVTLKMSLGGLMGREEGQSVWRSYRFTDGDLHASDWHIVKER